MLRWRSILEAAVRLARVYPPLAALHNPYNSKILVKATLTAQLQWWSNKYQHRHILQSPQQSNQWISLRGSPQCSPQERRLPHQLKNHNTLKVLVQQILMHCKRRLVSWRLKTDNSKVSHQAKTRIGCLLSTKHRKATDRPFKLRWWWIDQVLQLDQITRYGSWRLSWRTNKGKKRNWLTK